MTATVQTSSILSQSDYRFKNYARKRHHMTENFYQATITDFDGDEYDYDVMAESYEEAAAQLESIAYEADIQVSNMNIYLVG